MMRVSDEFILREIAGEYMLVPVGSAAAAFNGLITMNEVGNFIFNAMHTDRTVEELVEQITSEYEVPAETARTDLMEFLEQLRRVNALVEE